MNTHKIVVYTPVEDAIFNSEHTFPVMVATALFIAMLVITAKLLESFVGRGVSFRKRQILELIPWIVASLSAIACIISMT